MKWLIKRIACFLYGHDIMTSISVRVTYDEVSEKITRECWSCGKVLNK